KRVEADGNANVFISPTSAFVALALAYNGAAGDTKAEIASVLQVDHLAEEAINDAIAQLIEGLNMETDKTEPSIANSLWLHKDYTFQEAFIQKGRTHFNA